MSQEEKNKILFEALSQYLPSKLICHISDGENVDVDRVLTGVTINGCYFDDNGAFYGWNSFDIKPYVREFSSIMTDEEEKEFFELARDYNVVIGGFSASFPCAKLIDWLIAHHFDYRNLIPKELAIRVTKENNPYKK